jgi:hypothetical protein
MKATNIIRHGYEYVSQRPEKKDSACAGMLKHVSEKKHSIEKLKPIFAAEGCVLLETFYNDNKTPMKFKCVCGKIGKISYKHFKHGERCNSKPCMKSRKEATNLERFNSKSYTGTPAYKESKTKTCLAKYGVPDPLQSPEVQERIENSCYRFKPFTLPSGTVVKLQGYEPLALTHLLKTYKESQNLIGRKAQPEIWWTDAEGKLHRYFSDFFIPSTNKVIEVKSTWTLEKGIQCLKIPAMQAAVEEAGYEFILMVFNDKEELIPDYLIS